MPYIVNYTDDNKQPIVVLDRSLDSESTSISLVGRDYVNYGEFIAENFLHILENFSSISPPDNPIEGQLWYDRNANQLKIYTSIDQWRIVSGNIVGSNEPNTDNINIGDIWFNAQNKNLYIYDGVEWSYFATTQLEPDEDEPEEYVTLNTVQTINASKTFNEELIAKKISIDNNDSGEVMLELTDASPLSPGIDKVMMKLTGNGNPLLVLNHDDGGDYEFRSGDTALRLNTGSLGIENLRRVNGIWTNIFRVDNSGIAGTSIATIAEAQAKTSNTKIMTPARVFNAVDHFVARTKPSGGVQATEAEAIAGVANDVVMTPERVRQYFRNNIILQSAVYQFRTPAGLTGGEYNYDVDPVNEFQNNLIDRGFNFEVFNNIPGASLRLVNIPESITPSVITIPTWFLPTGTPVGTTAYPRITLPPGIYQIDITTANSSTAFMMHQSVIRRAGDNAVLFFGTYDLNLSGIIQLTEITDIKYTVFRRISPFYVEGLIYSSFGRPSFHAYHESDTVNDNGVTRTVTEIYDTIRIVKLG